MRQRSSLFCKRRRCFVINNKYARTRRKTQRWGGLFTSHKINTTSFRVCGSLFFFVLFGVCAANTKRKHKNTHTKSVPLWYISRTGSDELGELLRAMMIRCPFDGQSAQCARKPEHRRDVANILMCRNARNYALGSGIVLASPLYSFTSQISISAISKQPCRTKARVCNRYINCVER